MSARRHPIAAPSAGRLAAVLAAGRVTTGAPGAPGAPGDQSEHNVQINEKLLAELKSIHSPCITHLDETEHEHGLVNMLEQLAKNLSIVVDGRAAVTYPNKVKDELDAFQKVWAPLMYKSFPEATFKEVAKQTADTLDRFTKQEAFKETLLRFMEERMRRFCIEYRIDAITEMTREVEKSADLLSTVGKDGKFRASSNEVMDVAIGILSALGGLHVLLTYSPESLEPRSVMDLPNAKYKTAMAALRDAVNDIRVYVESVFFSSSTG